MPGKSYKENNRFCTLLLQFCFFLQKIKALHFVVAIRYLMK